MHAFFFVIIITKYALMKNMRKYCKWFHLYFALSILSYIEMIIPIKVHIICSCSIRCTIIKNDVFAITTQGQVIPMSLKLIPKGKTNLMCFRTKTQGEDQPYIFWDSKPRGMTNLIHLNLGVFLESFRDFCQKTHFPT